MDPLIAPGDIPYLPRGVRLAEDRVRGMPVLLAPERALQLDPIGHAILTELDGQRSLQQIATDLAQRYEAPQAEIMTDMSDFLTGLIQRRMVFVRSAP